MTADVVNLRRARKVRARAAQETLAAANRAAHGRSRTDRDAVESAAARAQRRLDGHRLTRDGEGGDA